MLLFTKVSLIFAVTILILGVGIALIRGLRGSAQYRPIITSLVAYFGLSVCYFLDQTLYSAETDLFYYLQYPFVLTLCYAFFEACVAMSTKLSIRVLKAIRISMAVAVLVWLPLWLFSFFTEGSIQLQNALVALPIFLIFATFIWLGTRLVQLQKSSARGLLSDWKEDRQQVRETLSFFGIISLTLSTSLVLIMLRSRFGDPTNIAVIFIAMNGIIILLICVCYLKYVARRFEVASQLMFGLQTVFLVVASIVLITFFDDQDFQPVEVMRHLDHHELHFEVPASGQYKVSSARSQLEDLHLTRVGTKNNGTAAVQLPFSFSLGGNRTDTIWITSNGAISFSQPDSSRRRDAFCLEHPYRIVALCSGGETWAPKMFLSPDRATFDWHTRDEDDFVARLTLFPDSSFRMQYREMPKLQALFLRQSIGFTLSDAEISPPTLLSDLPYVSTGHGFWFDLTLMHRQAMHAIYLPIMSFIVGVFALNALLVWYWVNYRVRTPLRRTLKALDGVRDGDLANQLTSKNHDEFADLAASFGNMENQLRELRAGQDEITDAIEAELKVRKLDIALDERLPDAESGDSVLLDRILDTIDTQGHRTDFQVLDLAKNVGLSTRQLHRKTLDLAGVTPLTLIRRVRLKKAQKILQAGGNSVSKAAYGCGFRDIAYFSKIYRSELGELPSDTVKQS